MTYIPFLFLAAIPAISGWLAWRQASLTGRRVVPAVLLGVLLPFLGLLAIPYLSGDDDGP